MTNSIDDIPIKMNAMENTDPMRSHIRGMNASMRNMTITGDQMRNEMTCRGGIYRPSVVKVEQYFLLLIPEPGVYPPEGFLTSTSTDGGVLSSCL